jgi:flagellar motor protein MotB
MREGFGADYWATATYLGVALALGLATVAALPQDEARQAQAQTPRTHDDDMLALVRARTLTLQHWPRVLASLCRDPALLAAGAAPDCARGVIELSDADFFDEPGQLSARGRRRLARGIPLLLQRLRDDPVAWRELDAIEVRGHADPRSIGDPYPSNLAASQQRAQTVLLFLTREGTLSPADRAAIQRLAIVSGVADSRPPADCRDRSATCDERARRVEIRLRVDPGTLRARLGGFYGELTRILR